MSAFYNKNHWKHHHQTWQVDSTWQVLINVPVLFEVKWSYVKISMSLHSSECRSTRYYCNSYRQPRRRFKVSDITSKLLTFTHSQTYTLNVTYDRHKELAFINTLSTFFENIFCRANPSVAQSALTRPMKSNDSSVTDAIMTPQTIGRSEQYTCWTVNNTAMTTQLWQNDHKSHLKHIHTTVTTPCLCSNGLLSVFTTGWGELHIGSPKQPLRTGRVVAQPTVLNHW